MPPPTYKHVPGYNFRRRRVNEPLAEWLVEGFYKAIMASLTNIYFLANIVFLGYSIGILLLDFTGEAFYPDSTGYIGNYNWNLSTDQINQQYIGWNFVHLVNALMYILAWWQYGFPLLHFIHLPELLNVTAAVLYISSSFYYSKEQTTSDDYGGPPYNDFYTGQVHNIEMAASTIELVAAFGWAFTWWWAYERLPGRGWSLDDPDTWSNTFIIIGSFIYIVYNAQVMMDHSIYGSYYLYIYGDVAYFISAVFYVVAAMRDSGWWFWLPLAGKWGYETVPMESEESTTPKASRLSGATPTEDGAVALLASKAV